MSWLAPYRERAAAGGSVFVSYRAAERSIAIAKQMIGKWPKNALRHSYATYRLAQCHDAARVALEMVTRHKCSFGIIANSPTNRMLRAGFQLRRIDQRTFEALTRAKACECATIGSRSSH